MKFGTFWTFILILPKLKLIFGSSSRAPRRSPVFLPTSTNFEEITKCSGFVDKTLFIHAFFTFESSYHIFTRPRKFGKSTNMDMLKRFVQLEVDDDGKVKKKFHTRAYQFFANQTLNLRISSYYNIINDHLAKYPVIHIEFKGIMKNTFKETLKNIRERVRIACLPYQWMIEILHHRFQKTNDSNIAQQVRFLRKAIHGTMNLDITMKSLSLLAKVLLNYFRRQLFVFIDDYDEALDHGLRHAHKIKYDPTKVRCLMNTMMGNLFDEPMEHIKYIMITGLALGSPSMFDKHQICLQHHQFLHSFEMASFFGFTDDQVADLLTRHGIHENEKFKLAEFYNGYISPQWNITLYNPIGVLNYLASFEPTSVTYPLMWIDPGSLDFMVEALKNSRIYTSLVQILIMKTGYFMVQSYTNEKRLIMLAAQIKNKVPLEPKKVVAFFWYCMENGYITKTKSWAKQILPNKEMEIRFTELLSRFYDLHVGNITRPLSHTLKKLIANKNADKEIFNLKRQLEMLMNSEPKFDDGEELHYYSLIYYSAKAHCNYVITYIKRRQVDLVHYIVANKTRSLTVIAVKFEGTLKEALKHASVYKTDKFSTGGKTIRQIGIRFNLKERVADVAYFSPNDRQRALYTIDSKEEEFEESPQSSENEEEYGQPRTQRRPVFLYSESYDDEEN